MIGTTGDDGLGRSFESAPKRPIQQSSRQRPLEVVSPGISLEDTELDPFKGNFFEDQAIHIYQQTWNILCIETSLENRPDASTAGSFALDIEYFGRPMQAC